MFGLRIARKETIANEMWNHYCDAQRVARRDLLRALGWKHWLEEAPGYRQEIDTMHVSWSEPWTNARVRPEMNVYEFYWRPAAVPEHPELADMAERKEMMVTSSAAVMGKRGGKKSLETMTREERVARAKKAVAAREAKKREEI